MSRVSLAQREDGNPNVSNRSASMVSASGAEPHKQGTHGTILPSWRRLSTLQGPYGSSHNTSIEKDHQLFESIAVSSVSKPRRLSHISSIPGTPAPAVMANATPVMHRPGRVSDGGCVATRHDVTPARTPLSQYGYDHYGAQKRASQADAGVLFYGPHSAASQKVSSSPKPPLSVLREPAGPSGWPDQTDNGGPPTASRSLGSSALLHHSPRRSQPPGLTPASGTGGGESCWDTLELKDTTLADQFSQLFTGKHILEHCLKQDETALVLDDYIGAVPIGTYLPVTRAFSLLPKEQDAFQDQRVLGPLSGKDRHAYPVPASLSEAYSRHQASLGSAGSVLSGAHRFLCGSVADVDLFWYVSESTLYLWKWSANSEQQAVELTLKEPITAVAVVDPKHFFTHETSNVTDVLTPAVVGQQAPVKLVVIATPSELSLWALRLSLDVHCVFDISPTPYKCSSPSSRVVTLVGHDDSGRVFFGDSLGGIYEFVFHPPEPSVQSWGAFLAGLTPWGRSKKRRQGDADVIALTEKVVAPSVLTRVLGRLVGSARAVIVLSVDLRRGLVYAVDEASNIQVFFLPPPEVTAQTVSEFPLQPVAALPHTTLISQMANVSRQALRAVHQQQVSLQQEEDVESLSKSGFSSVVACSEVSLQSVRVTQVIPLGSNEGKNVVAVALTQDGCRLYLRLRKELPLLPKALQRSCFPDITNYQYTRTLDVVNWKPPPFSEPYRPANRTALTDSDGGATKKGTGGYVFYNNRTFLRAVPSGAEESKSCPISLACVTPDETSVFQRQAKPVDLIDGVAPARNKTLREWCQSLPLPQGNILAVYERPLVCTFQHLLDKPGPLPSPYDVLGRMCAERLEVEVNAIEADAKVSSTHVVPQGLVNGATESTQNGRVSSSGCRQSPLSESVSRFRKQRVSLSPWDMPFNNSTSVSLNSQAPAVPFLGSREGDRTSSSLASGLRLNTALCHRYIAPSSLHTLAATQTVPARIFVILTTNGVYQVQQKRLYDLLKDAAATLAENPTQAYARIPNATINMSMKTPNVTSSGITSSITPSFCTAPLAPTDLETAARGVLSSPDPTGISWLLNFYVASYLLTPEQAMAAVWQTLTFIWGTVPWPGSSLDNKTSPSTFTALAPSAARRSITSLPTPPRLTTLSRSAPRALETPERRLPFAGPNQGSVGEFVPGFCNEGIVSPYPPTTIKNGQHIPIPLGLEPSAAAQQPYQQRPTISRGFVLSVLTEALVHGLTSQTLHGEPAFQDSLFSLSAVEGSPISAFTPLTSYHPLFATRGAPPFAPPRIAGFCSRDQPHPHALVTAHPKPPSSYSVGSWTAIPARVKGLALYIARILRPFWTCPIFEPVVLEGSTQSFFMTLPAIYRAASTAKSSSEFPTTTTNKPNFSNDSGRQKKRPRPGLPTDGDLEHVLETHRSWGEHKSLSKPQNQHSSRGQRCIILASRFNAEEFSKCRQWLNQLSGVIQGVLQRLRSATGLSSNPSSKNGFASTPYEQYDLSHASGVSTNGYPTRCPPVVRTLQDWEDIRSEAELRLLRALELLCTVSSQMLTCCALFMNVRESRELSSEIFDTLSGASLSQLLLSFLHREALLHLVTRQILSPQVLMEHCYLLFSQKDLEFQAALQPLKALHKSVCAQRLNQSDFADCVPMEPLSATRSKEFQYAIQRLLSVAQQPYRPERLEVVPLGVLLGELQLFSVLAEYLVRLAEAFLIEKGWTEKNTLPTPTVSRSAPGETTLHPPEVFQFGQSETNGQDAGTCYASDPFYIECHDQFYFVVELFLDRYKQAHQNTETQIGLPVAMALVQACLSIPITLPAGPYTNTKRPNTPLLRSKHSTAARDQQQRELEAKKRARTWLHYAVLDWINGTGKRAFPIPLEEVRSAVYASWVEQRKADLEIESSDILSRFFLSNGQYTEFAHFLSNMASKPWADPTQVLTQATTLPNLSTTSETPHLEETALASYLSPLTMDTQFRNGDTTSVRTKQWESFNRHWTTVVNYLRVTQGGLTLASRYGYLVQARDAVAAGLERQNQQAPLANAPRLSQSRTDPSPNELPGTSSSDGLVQSSSALRLCAATIDSMLHMVQLQMALCRETIEISIFLCLKYAETSLSRTFSTDASVRQAAAEELLRHSPEKHDHLYNVQSLLYMLQWRIYDSPTQLLRLIQEFAEASKVIIPYPGLALITEHSLDTKLPNVDDDTGASISKQSIVSSCVFCRGYISVELKEPYLLEDFVSKYLFSIISSRTSFLLRPDSTFHSGCQQLASTSGNLPPQQSISPEHSTSLLRFMSEIFVTLHEAAVAFRDILSTDKTHSGSNHSIATASFRWKSHWWLWPLTTLKRQLALVDNFVTWDKDRQLKGQQILPVFQTVVRDYNFMLSLSVNPEVSEKGYLGLERYHYYAILLDLQESWLLHLYEMSNTLPYFVSSSSQGLLWLSSNSSTLTTGHQDALGLPSSSSSALHSHHRQSSRLPLGISIASSSRCLPSWTRGRHQLKSGAYGGRRSGSLFGPRCHSPIRTSTIDTDIPISSAAIEQDTGASSSASRLVAYLLDIFQKSPSKLQSIWNKCNLLIRAWEAAIQEHIDWYSKHGPVITRLIESMTDQPQLTSDSHPYDPSPAPPLANKSRPEKKPQPDEHASPNIPFLSCTSGTPAGGSFLSLPSNSLDLELREKAFLKTLEQLQQRLPILKAYENTTHRIMSQTIVTPPSLTTTDTTCFL